MPGGDRTGPLGLGPRTGRGMGWCSPYQGWGAGPFGRGRGVGWFGRGRGFGRGWWCGWRGPGWGGGRGRWAFYGTAYDPEDPSYKDVVLNDMKAYASRLEAELNTLRNQMKEMEEGTQEQ